VDFLIALSRRDLGGIVVSRTVYRSSYLKGSKKSDKFIIFKKEDSYSVLFLCLLKIYVLTNYKILEEENLCLKLKVG